MKDAIYDFVEKRIQDFSTSDEPQKKLPPQIIRISARADPLKEQKAMIDLRRSKNEQMKIHIIRRITMSTKRKTSHIMALLLTLCMVFTLLPMTAFSAEPAPITAVDVSGITGPKLGEKPDCDGILPEGAPYHFASKEELEKLGYSKDYINDAKNGILWWDYYDEIIKPDGTFDGSSLKYFVDIVLVPENGYVFAEDVSATINGEATLVDTLYSESYGTDFHIVSVELALEIPESSRINQANVKSLNLPVAGETPDYDVSLPEDANYRLATKEEIAAFTYDRIVNASKNGVVWFDNGRPISPDTIFVEGKEYYVGVILVAKDGYVFVESATGAFNGNPELFEKVTSQIMGKIFAHNSVQLKAAAASNAYTLTTSVDGGHGTIAPEGTKKIVKGETETVIFTPDSGYVIDKVTVNGVETGVTSNVLEVTMDGNKTVVVTYKQATVASHTPTDATGHSFGEWHLEGGVLIRSCACGKTESIFQYVWQSLVRAFTAVWLPVVSGFESLWRWIVNILAL